MSNKEQAPTTAQAAGAACSALRFPPDIEEAMARYAKETGGSRWTVMLESLRGYLLGDLR